MRFRVSCDNRYTIGPSLKNIDCQDGFKAVGFLAIVGHLNKQEIDCKRCVESMRNDY